MNSDQRPATTALATSVPGRPVTWATVFLLIAGVFALRVMYLVWLCPYELVGDEAQYWVWSRHLDLSYYSKGPGVAWAIAASTRVFGNSEAAVRLPAAVAAAVAMGVLAKLAADCSGGEIRTGFWAAVLFCLVPGYLGMAQLMTIDAPYVACWILAVWAFWRLAQRQRSGQPTGWCWLGLALALGVGFLFKYTILLLIPGLVIFAILERRQLHWNAKSALGLSLFCLVFLLVISPVLIWNHRHGWPTVAHLLGAIGAPGGDRPQASGTSWSYNPRWSLEMLGSQVGIIGPVILLLAVGVWQSIKRRDLSGAAPGAGLLMTWAALPVLLFYAAISVAAKVQGNWMLAGYTTLLVLAARLITGSSTRFIRRAWKVAVVYGCIAALGVMLPQVAAKTPVVGRFVPLWRLVGQKAVVAQVKSVAEQLEQHSGQKPAIVAASYGQASLLSYYLPDHPPIPSATSWLGGRRSSHDFFADTVLTDAKLSGRPVILVGADLPRWQSGFRFEQWDTVDADARIWVGHTYRGRDDS